MNYRTGPAGSGSAQLDIERAAQRRRVAAAIRDQLMRMQFTDDIRAKAVDAADRHEQEAIRIENDLKLGGWLS